MSHIKGHSVNDKNDTCTQFFIRKVVLIVVILKELLSFNNQHAVAQYGSHYVKNIHYVQCSNSNLYPPRLFNCQTAR